MVGIEKNEFIYPQRVQRKIDKLTGRKAGFIEGQIKEFLQSYGKRRGMPSGIETTEFVLSKLTERPVYYVWFNKETAFSV